MIVWLQQTDGLHLDVLGALMGLQSDKTLW